MKYIFDINRWKVLLKSWKALFLYSFGSQERAMNELQECLNLDPFNGPNLSTFGKILIYKGNYSDGIQRLREALQNLSSLAFAYSQLNRSSDAIEFYEKAIHSWSKDREFKKIDLFYNVGRLYLQVREHPEAARAFKKGLEIKSDEARLHFGLGIAYYEMGQHEECLQHLKIAIDLEPALKNDETLRKLGTISITLSDLGNQKSHC